MCSGTLALGSPWRPARPDPPAASEGTADWDPRAPRGSEKIASGARVRTRAARRTRPFPAPGGPEEGPASGLVPPSRAARDQFLRTPPPAPRMTITARLLAAHLFAGCTDGSQFRTQEGRGMRRRQVPRESRGDHKRVGPGALTPGCVEGREAPG